MENKNGLVDELEFDLDEDTFDDGEIASGDEEVDIDGDDGDNLDDIDLSDLEIGEDEGTGDSDAGNAEEELDLSDIDLEDEGNISAENPSKSDEDEFDLSDINIGDSEKSNDTESMELGVNDESDDSGYESIFGKDMDIESDGKTDKSDDLDELDREIARLKAEIEQGNQSDGSADIDGSILDSNTLLDEAEDDEPSSTTSSNNFISPTGEIVVMDPNVTEDTFKLIYVDIDNIAISKRIRLNTNVEDLVKSIKSTGLLKPIDVAPTNADGVYVLLDGYRRIMACARAGRRSIPCVVNTKVSVPEIPIIEAMHNHQKRYSIKEQIDYIDYLEKQKGIMSASMIEYLLQMNSGDYTKLKDILNDNDDDIVSKLMDGIYTIDTAFKKLEQRRKKESAEEKELKKATKVYEEDPDSGVDAIADSGEMGVNGAELSEEEIKDIYKSPEEIDEEIQGEDLNDMVKAGKEQEGFEPHKQDPKYRERLDPVVRKAVLAKYNNTCHVCKVSGMEYVETLDIHHIVEVYLGGNDAIENLIPVCTVCHKLIHLWGRGELQIRDSSELTPEENAKFKRVIHYGNIIRDGMKRKGMKVEQLKKMDNTETIGRTKPGTGQVAG